MGRTFLLDNGQSNRLVTRLSSTSPDIAQEVAIKNLDFFGCKKGNKDQKHTIRKVFFREVHSHAVLSQLLHTDAPLLFCIAQLIYSSGSVDEKGKINNLKIHILTESGDSCIGTGDEEQHQHTAGTLAKYKNISTNNVIIQCTQMIFVLDKLGIASRDIKPQNILVIKGLKEMAVEFDTPLSFMDMINQGWFAPYYSLKTTAEDGFKNEALFRVTAKGARVFNQILFEKSGSGKLEAASATTAAVPGPVSPGMTLDYMHLHLPPQEAGGDKASPNKRGGTGHGKTPEDGAETSGGSSIEVCAHRVKQEKPGRYVAFSNDDKDRTPEAEEKGTRFTVKLGTCLKLIDIACRSEPEESASGHITQIAGATPAWRVERPLPTSDTNKAGEPHENWSIAHQDKQQMGLVLFNMMKHKSKKAATPSQIDLCEKLDLDLDIEEHIELFWTFYCDLYHFHTKNHDTGKSNNANTRKKWIGDQLKLYQKELQRDEVELEIVPDEKTQWKTGYAILEQYDEYVAACKAHKVHDPLVLVPLGLMTGGCFVDPDFLSNAGIIEPKVTAAMKMQEDKIEAITSYGNGIEMQDTLKTLMRAVATFNNMSVLSPSVLKQLENTRTAEDIVSKAASLNTLGFSFGKIHGIKLSKSWWKKEWDLFVRKKSAQENKDPEEYPPMYLTRYRYVEMYVNSALAQGWMMFNE
ncbi:unnamed protein product [Amoebophrya sp. A120]|nr:unnamed protein product [Amoebophrya sp. A120]|eukprot:GSA120T00000888001.1